MNKDDGFAPLMIVIVLVLIAMAMAQCDVRYASAGDRPTTTHTGSTR